MNTATRSPLTEQAEKLGNLARYLSDGRLLEQVLRKAQTGDVWSGPVQQGFLAWLQFAVDGWVRNQLATGVRLVAESLQKRAEQINSAAQAMAAGTATTVSVPPPTPLNYTPGRPPPYGDIGGGAQSKFNPDGMTELAKMLEVAADDTVITFGRGLRSALEPPLPPPAAPGAPPPISPLPPDAAAAVGDPASSSPGANAYLALADELHRAADDITRRVRALRLVDEPLPTATLDPNLVSNVTAGTTALVSGSETAEQQAAAPDTPTANPEYRDPAPVDEKPPPTQQEIEDAQREGDALADRAIKEDVLNHPGKMAEIVKEMNEGRKGPAAEAYAAAFVEKFGADRMRQVPRTLQAWQYNYTAANPGASYHPPKHTLPLGEPKRKPGDTEIEDILYSFSATLATASNAEGRPKLDKELDKLAHDEKDPLALSWLLTNRDAEFDADFLVGCFDSGVKKVIEWEARERKPYSEAGMGGEIGLGVEGDRLLDRNPKVAVLNAISHNPEAAYRLQTEFQPFTLEVYHGSSEVKIDNISQLLYRGGEYGGYGDNGSAMGRMLDATHRALLQEGNAAEAQRFVEQLTNAATNNGEVERARSYLRDIGVRHHLNDDQAENARAMVERNSKHPARELLLGQVEGNMKASAEFVKDAAAGNKYTQKTLYETRAAWNVVKAAELAEGATEAQKHDAETTLDRTMRKIADGEDLTDDARRGMADVLSLHLKDVAMIIGGNRGEEEALEDRGLGVTEEQVRATLKEIARDKEALGALMAALGASVAEPYTEVVDAMRFSLRFRPPGMPDAAWRAEVADKVEAAGKGYAQEAQQIGEMFCETADAVRQVGIDKREAAAAMLANYRLGVDIAFGFIEKIPGVGQAKAVVDTAVGVVPSTKVAGFEGEVKDGIAAAISGIDTELISAETKEESARARELLDRMVAENMMQAIARDPVVLSQLEVTLPDGMLVNPGQPLPPPVGEPPRIPDGFLKPEFVDSRTGGVLLPRPGSEHYKEFSKWYREDEDAHNSLYQAALNASEPVREHMGKCMLEKLWGEAS